MNEKFCPYVMVAFHCMLSFIFPGKSVCLRSWMNSKNSYVHGMSTVPLSSLLFVILIDQILIAHFNFPVHKFGSVFIFRHTSQTCMEFGMSGF